MRNVLVKGRANDIARLTAIKPVASLPLAYVTFIRRRWVVAVGRHGGPYYRKYVRDQFEIFQRLLLSHELGAVLEKLYALGPIGGKITKTLVDQALAVPGVWRGADKRITTVREKQLERLETTIESLVKILDEDRSDPQDKKPEVYANDVDLSAHRPAHELFRDVVSEELKPGLWRRWRQPARQALRGSRLQLSVYELHEILRAFIGP